MRGRPVVVIAGVALVCGLGLANWASGTKPRPWPGVNDLTRPAKGVFSAMQKELDRTQGKLKIAGSPEPYHLAVAVIDRQERRVSYSLGAPLTRYRHRNRAMKAAVRVGSYQSDNTGFYGVFRYGRYVAVPFAANRLALRRAAYFALDRSYKNAVRQHSRKLAFLQRSPRTGIPDNWTRAPAKTHIARLPAGSRSVDFTAWAAGLKQASASFRAHPGIQSSSATLSAGSWAAYVKTSEGTTLFRPAFRVGVRLHASTQASDGMSLSYGWAKIVADAAKLPTAAEVTREAAKVAKTLTALAKAPKLDERYSGPVLFADNAAAEVMLATVGVHLSGNEPPLAWSRRAVFEKMVGRRILPDWITVTDDPTLKAYRRKRLVGHYRVDDEGVDAKKVSLVEKGKLKAFLSSRRPTKDVKKSNGHGRSAWGDPLSVVAMPSNLLVLPRRPVPARALTRRYLKLLKKDGLKYGYIVRSTRSSASMGLGLLAGANLRLPQPILVYRVDQKGKETLMRGVKIGAIPSSELARIVVMGGKPVVLNKWLGGATGLSVVTYSFILQRAELSPVRPAQRKAPILPSPLSKGQ